jgi:hypothetical protein
MSFELTSNPCEGEGVIFDSENVTVSQREWLTHQVVSKNITAAAVAKKYNLKGHVVYNWCSRHRRGLKRRTAEGRPRVLDKIALQSVQEWIEEASANVDDIPGLKRVLNEGYRDTKRRCVRKVINDDAEAHDSDSDSSDDVFESAKMCKGTMFNYLHYAQTDEISRMVESS